MKSLLMASKVAMDPLLVNIPLDGSLVDLKGRMSPTVMGYPNGIPVFEEIDGRKALKVSVNVGVRFQQPSDIDKLFSTDTWALEFEVRFLDPTVFKHDSILGVRKSTALNDYTMALWKRAQSGNRVIMLGADSKSETNPILIEAVAPTALVWRKYRVEHSKTGSTRTLKFLVNGAQVGSKVVVGDYSADIIDILWTPNPNPFNGWIRDLKVYR